MNKKLCTLFIIAILVSLIYASFASASVPAPYLPTTHVEQYYSVVYDGEGDALVLAHFDIHNQGFSPLLELYLELPYDQVELYAVAERTEFGTSKECIRYVSGCVEYGSGSTCVSYDINGNCLEQQRPCLQTGDVCEAYKSIETKQTGYVRLDVTPTQLASSVGLPLVFSDPLEDGDMRTVLLFFKIPQHALEKSNHFEYGFESVRLPILTSSVRVSVDVDSGLILKGLKPSTSYVVNVDRMQDSYKKMGSSSSSAFEMYAQNRYSSLGLTETSGYLDPHESFISKGKYSSSWSALYWGRIVLFIGILVVLVFAAILFSKRMKVFSKTTKKSAKKQHYAEQSGFIVPFLSGLYTSLSILGLWILTLIFMGLGETFLRHSHFWDVLGILFLILAILGSLALIIGIPIHMSKKHGSSVGVYSLLSTLGWLFIFFIIAFIVATLLQAPSVTLLR
jgi:hypothetical protein